MFTLKRLTFVGVAVFAISLMMTGCASAPKLGEPTPLQQTLNTLPEVPAFDKTLKFEFGGNIWFAKLDGKEFLAGTLASEEADGVTSLTLTATHTYSSEQKPGVGGDIGWLPIPAAIPAITLKAKEGAWVVNIPDAVEAVAEAAAPVAEAVAPAVIEAVTEQVAPPAAE